MQMMKMEKTQFTIRRPNEWITDISSFYTKQLPGLYIEAVEPSVILIKHNDLLFLYTHYHKFDRDFRIIVALTGVYLNKLSLF